MFEINKCLHAGVSARTLWRCLDATYYYRWELTLPQDKRMNPATEAACIMWDVVQGAEPEQRLRIMDVAQREVSAHRDGKLTKEAAATAKQKALEYLVPQVKAESAGHIYFVLPANE
jgi:hypothetical protein